MKTKLQVVLGTIFCGAAALIGTTSTLLGTCCGPLYQPNVPEELKK